MAIYDAKNSLLINQAYSVISSITGLLYIDENRTTYLFFTREEAKKYLKNIQNIVLQDKKFIEPDDFCSICFEQGIHKIMVFENGKENYIKLNKKNVKRKFYNSDLNAMITLFKETQNSHYLREIAACWFIIPVRINFDLSPEIVYGTVHLKDNSYKYLAFSDINEYEKWARDVVGWKPLIVNFDVLCQISKKCGYIINVKGNTLVFPSAIMEKYRKYSLTADPTI